LGKILIVSNTCIFGSNVDLLEQVKKEHTIHMSPVEEAYKLTDETYFEVTVLQVGERIDEATRKFVEDLQIKQTQFTPLIFVSENLDLEEFMKFRYKSWSTYCKQPLVPKEFFHCINKGMATVKQLRLKTIILKKKDEAYHYQVCHILCIHRSRLQHIKIYYCNDWNTEKRVVEKHEFFYPGSLHRFMEHHDIGDQIIQVHQGWLVNPWRIRSRSLTQIIALDHGSVASIPIGRSYRKKVAEYSRGWRGLRKLGRIQRIRETQERRRSRLSRYQ